MFMSDWLTDLASLHLSIVNDQSFLVFRWFSYANLIPGQDPVQRFCFSFHLACPSCPPVPLLMYCSSRRSPHRPTSSSKCYLSFTVKENQPSAMHLILNKHFLLYRALLEPHYPQPPCTTLHDLLPNLRCLVYILSATTLLNQGFLKKLFFTFINMKR